MGLNGRRGRHIIEIPFFHEIGIRRQNLAEILLDLILRFGEQIYLSFNQILLIIHALHHRLHFWRHLPLAMAKGVGHILHTRQ